MKTFFTVILTLYSMTAAASDASNASSVALVSNPVSKSVVQFVQERAVEQAALVSGLDRANMNPEVRAQDNFYQYVNGGWLASHHIGADKTVIGSFYDLRDRADHDVRAIIDELAASENLQVGTDEQKISDFFQSFQDTQIIETLGIKPIQDVLNAIDAMQNKQDFARFIGTYDSIGVANPLSAYIAIDSKDSTRYAVYVWQGGLGLPDQDYYFNEGARFVGLRAGYLKHVENMFHLAGFENAGAAAQTTFAIETELAEHNWTPVENRDHEKRYNKYRTSKLKKLSKEFDWDVYLKALGVDSESHIIINQPSYIEGFGKVFAARSLADWKTYLKFHTISNFSTYLTDALDTEDFDFYAKQLSGRNEPRPRWKRAVAVVNDNLGEAIGKVYVARHFTAQAKSRVNIMVRNLSNAYAQSIEDLDWMTPATKKAALIKLDAFTSKIGYPDKWEDYSDLKVDPKDLVGNIMRARTIGANKEVSKLGGPIRTWEWLMTPQMVNAYYNPSVNEIVFPAAILQPPFFNLAADDAVNYGGIGAIIGHEMGHGFDDQGSKYDAKGNLRNWWTKKDLAEFKARSANLVTQYSQYKVYDDLYVNGELTLSENIGDLSGVTIAYKAYQTSLNGKPAPIIDELTGDQRFFMGFAQVWRSKFVEETMRNIVATDSHSPEEFRALGALSNMDEFYQTFDVKEGDAMYIEPENRVKIW